MMLRTIPNKLSMIIIGEDMTEQDKAYEINELTHRTEAAKRHLEAILNGSIPGDIKMFEGRIKDFESRMERLR